MRHSGTWPDSDANELDGPSTAKSRERDTTDYEHRHFVNLCATAFLLRPLRFASPGR